MTKKKKKQIQIESKYERISWLNIIFLISCFAILIYPRIFLFKNFFSDQTIILRNPDSCYHIRRILYIATHQMRLPFSDPLLAYPQGAVPIWSPLYDWVSAIPSFIIGLGNPAEKTVILISGFISILFGFLQLFFIGMLVYKASKNFSIAVLAAFLAGVTNFQMRYTSLETIDHNSLLLVLFSYALYKTYFLLNQEQHDKHIRLILSLSFTMALLSWTWPGSYIYYFVLAAIHGVYVFWSRKYWLLTLFAINYLIAAILIMPLALVHYQFSKDIFKFEHVSFLSVLSIISIAAIFYALSNIFAFAESKKPANALIAVMLLVILGTIAYYILVPLKEGMHFAEAGDKWLATIVESEPLFYREQGPTKIFTLGKAFSNLTYLVLIFPLAFILLIAKKIKTSLEMRIILLISAIILGILCAVQQKFVFEFSLPYGIVLALFIEWVYQRLAQLFSKHISLSIIIIAIIAGLYPVTANFKDLKPYFASFRASYHAYHWLKEDAHAPPMDINSSEAPQKGVMIPWQLGHHLQLYGQLPAVADNFWFIYLNRNPWQGFFDMVAFYYADNEETAIQILKKYKCEYVLVPHPLLFESYPSLMNADVSDYFSYSTYKKDGTEHVRIVSKERFLNTIGARLSMAYGSSNALGETYEPKYKSLKHFQLVYELPGPDKTGEPVPEGNIKIYRYVEGSELHVPVSSNSPYRLEGIITTSRNKNFYYRQEGYLKDKIIVPYPTKRIKDYPYAQSYKVYINDQIYSFDNVGTTWSFGSSQ